MFVIIEVQKKVLSGEREFVGLDQMTTLLLIPQEMAKGPWRMSGVIQLDEVWVNQLPLKQNIDSVMLTFGLSGLGEPATTKTKNRFCDAYLWVKIPGESDGKCNGGPKAGMFWGEQAEELVKNKLV